MEKDLDIVDRQKGFFKNLLLRIKTRLATFSFRTGVIVLLSCLPLYAISFAQFALPIPIGLKSALWVLFFGLAKCAQYGGLTILGANGVSRLRQWWKNRQNSPK